MSQDEIITSRERQILTEAEIKEKQETAKRAYKPTNVIVGVDLGKESDKTVFVVIEPTKEDKPTYYVKRVIPIPLGTTYPTIIRALQDLDSQLKTKYIAKEIIYVIDAGGVGGVVLDSFEEAMPLADIYGVHITSGYQPTGEGYRLGVPKRELVNVLKKAHEERRIKVPYHLFGRKDAGTKLLEDELGNFKMKRLQSGWEMYEAAGSGHDDAVSALMLAVWYGEREAAKGPLRLF